jgi:dolichyl-phosphate-mannose--protein O-mannosyl transferase
MLATNSSDVSAAAAAHLKAHSGVRTRSAARVRITALLLGIVALLLFLWHIGEPAASYYDEEQYIGAARALIAGAANSNPEAPPLGKIIVAAGIRFFGDNPRGWRAPGALCGALTLVGVFLWVNLLLGDYSLALTAALLTLLDNFLFVMSRVAMMDIFLVTFMIWGLVAFTKAIVAEDLNVTQRRIFLGLSGVLLGLAGACKWNGVDTLLATIAVAIFLLWKRKHSQDEGIIRYGENLARIGPLSIFLSLIVAPTIAYAAAFVPLFHSLHQPFEIKQFFAMNAFIWRFHRTIVGNHAIASPWYSWILQLAPQRALSYLVGNWIVMWGGLLALAVCFRRAWNSLPAAFIVLLYSANILQWAFTPQKNLYYYYYFPAAIFLGVAIPVALYQTSGRIFGLRLNLLCLLAAACAFLYCFPHMAHLESPYDCALGCWI